MKTKGKAWHLIATVLLIVVFVYTAFFGVYAKYGDTTTTYIKGAKDIRFGVDIKGGVNVTFVPSDGYDATEEQLEAAQLVIENRLVALNVTDYELYVDNNSDSLILEFPWQSGETDFDPEAAIDEIGTTAYLTFREGSSADGELILDGSMIESAAAQYGPVSNGGASEYFVSLKFTDDGAKAFGDATTKLAASGGTISIWLDDENVSTATVNTAITDGSAIITSSASNPFTQEQVVKMARQINSGALPFALTVDSYSTVSPSLGENSLSAMVLAGLIAFALIVVFMTMLYRLPGFLACIALAGQVAATLAFVSGYFPVFESFTMSDVQKVASSALENNGLTLQTGENVATGGQTLKISMPGTETVTTEQVAKLLDSLNESCPDNNFEQLSLSNVSAAMGTKFLQKSLVAVVFALVLILLYIALRFKNIGGLTGGMMAVLALVNDLMVVFGTFVLLRTALDGNFIAAMLTILGYSINDTVVVYDRIRENRTLMGKKASFEELVNHSVNQSARRTLITTITTVMALGVMCIVAKLYGLDSIFTFAFPLMMGMISGVYTSLCVSTSAWVLWSERKPKTKA